MSLENIKSQIEAFIKSSEAEVMLIKGKWGVGKTYFWNHYLEDNKSNVVLDKYSYVSLFGIDSLDKLKYSIFENVINKELIGSKPSLETFNSNKINLSESLGRKSINIIKSFFSSSSTLLDTLSYLSINKIIICIDDLERRSNKLELKDIFGLISQLKEQKDCKVILLVNDEENNENDSLNLYNEKVIDKELLFEPTTEEAINIAYETTLFCYDTVIENTTKLKITNIRILKKIERYIKMVEPLLTNYDKSLANQIIATIVLYTYCYYTSDIDTPNLEDIKSIEYTFIDNKNDSKDEKNHKKFLKNYGYQYTDNLDLVIYDLIKSGYIIETNFHQEAAKINNKLLNKNFEDRFSDAWDLYHESFDNNVDELISKMESSFKKNVQNISPNNFESTVELFNDLGFKKKADELIDYYIQNRINEIEVFNIGNRYYHGPIKNEIIIKKFNDIYLLHKKTKDPYKIISNIGNTQSWNEDDVKSISKLSVEEIKSILLSLRGFTLEDFIKWSLNLNQSKDYYKELTYKVKESLKLISKTSLLNKRRVNKYINIDA